ncbi:MAG: signal peptidase signal peptidase [Candidatus Berkelbacteria bacterium]|nr:signal peptidase signal peptidase [Candidatus Berkelbacteria bacterium]
MNQENNQPLTMPEGAIEKPKLSFWQRFFYGTGCLFELTKWIIVILVVGTLIHFYVGTLFIVDGESMEPNYRNGQYILVNRWQYHFGIPGRGDSVVLKFPGDPEHKKYIKRIIGLPGEQIQITDGRVYINGKILTESYIPANVRTIPNGSWKMREDDYFLLGDNRYNSSDSRIWGICPKRDLIGKAVFTLYPSNMFGGIKQASY